MRYTKPNFKHEWPEALRYRVFEKMGYEKWLKVANDGKPIRFSTISDITGNVDFDFHSLEKEKKDRFYDAYDNGVIEMPIVVKFNENNYDLVGGNTRIAGSILNKKDPYVWLIDISKKENVDESEILKGGLADDKTLTQLAKKHDAKGYYHLLDMVKSLKKQLEMGVKIEMEHTDSKEKATEIAMDHLWEDPSYYTKLKKIETKETDTSSSGGFEAPFSGAASPIIKRTLSNKIPNYVNEAMDSSVSANAAFDVPFGGGGTKGRKNPLKIDGPKSIYKNRAVKDKKFPRFGGPDAIFVKVKEKCKKFPYCNQGNTGALEFISEDAEFKEAIQKASEMYGIPYADVEKVVINEINKIFI